MKSSLTRGLGSSVVSWSLSFSEPIVVSDGSELATLRDAHDHLNKFSPPAQDAQEWKAAAKYLIEAAERGGAVAFARISVLRVIDQQINRVPMSELVAATLREVQQLTDQADPLVSDREASLSLPGVMEVLISIVSTPAKPVELSDPTSMRRERDPVVTMKAADERRLIVSETLKSAIVEAVQKAEPAFVDVIVQRISPKSRFDTNWAIKGVKFGKADREKANRAVTTVVERMQREFRLSDD
jgi:hypothetical protein